MGKKVYCACSCGGEVPPKKYWSWPSFLKRSPNDKRYINGHNKTRNPEQGVLPAKKPLNSGYKYFIRNRKRVYIHRAVIEEYLGRKLRKSEIVHHIDGDKTNNALENLMIVSRKEHAILHQKETDQKGRFLQVNK